MTFRIIDLEDGEVFESHDLARDAEDFVFSVQYIPLQRAQSHPLSFHYTPTSHFEDDAPVLLMVEGGSR